MEPPRFACRVPTAEAIALKLSLHVPQWPDWIVLCVTFLWAAESPQKTYIGLPSSFSEDGLLRTYWVQVGRMPPMI